MKTFIIILIIVVTIYFIYKNNRSATIPEIEPKNIPENGIILDIRTKQEHDKMSIERHHHFVELSELDPTKYITDNNITDEKVYILCRSGGRAKTAAKMFQKNGYDNAVVITGGIIEFLSIK